MPQVGTGRHDMAGTPPPRAFRQVGRGPYRLLPGALSCGLTDHRFSDWNRGLSTGSTVTEVCRPRVFDIKDGMNRELTMNAGSESTKRPWKRNQTPLAERTSKEPGPPMYEKLRSSNKRRTAEGHFFAPCAESEISETDLSSETWPADA